jgi:hypothetical protein
MAGGFWTFLVAGRRTYFGCLRVLEEVSVPPLGRNPLRPKTLIAVCRYITDCNDEIGTLAYCNLLCQFSQGTLNCKR